MGGGEKKERRKRADERLKWEGDIARHRRPISGEDKLEEKEKKTATGSG